MLSRAAACLNFALAVALAGLIGAAAGPVSARGSEQSTIEVAALPSEARDTLSLIKRGGPFRHRQDGSVFGNREQRLPNKQRGYYKEYTVATPGAQDRGARRIVAGAGSGARIPDEYYYSDDHYNSFRRIKE